MLGSFETASLSPARLPERAEATMRPLRIVVVEDDAPISMLLGEILEDMGHTVCAIENTEAGAVSSAALWHPDLMIVDLSLGEGCGIAAMDAIQRHGTMPHVFVSGDISRIRLLRPNAIMAQKPYREADIVDAIQLVVAPRH